MSLTWPHASLAESFAPGYQELVLRELLRPEGLEGEPGFDLQVVLVPGKDQSGRWRGMGWAPEWNQAAHRINIEDWREENNVWRGRMVVEINPDAWLPEDRQMVSGELEVEGFRESTRPGHLSGSYQGKVNGQEVRGKIEGRWQEKVPSSGEVWVWRWEGSANRGLSWRRWMEVRLWKRDGTDEVWYRSGIPSDSEWEKAEDPIIRWHGDREVELAFTLPTGEAEATTARVRLRGESFGRQVWGEWTVRGERDPDRSWERRGVTRGLTRAATVAERIGWPDQTMALPEWAGDWAWSRQVKITEMPGESWDERLEAAQEELGPRGGIVFFPAGDYALADHIRLRDGIILLGEPPRHRRAPTHAEYQLGTRLHFPRYEMVQEGEGTALNTAFKGIRLADPVGGSRVGVFWLDIDHGTIHLGQRRGFARHAEQNRLGRQWIIYGNILRHAASPLDLVPAPHQHAWQRFTDRYRGAVHLWTGGEVMVAQNRFPRSTDNFVMRNFLLSPETPATHERVRSERAVAVEEVIFDYDNRPGIVVNGEPLGDGLQIWRDWASITEDPTAERTTDLPPQHGLAKGIEIEGNFIYATGGAAITTSGDGTVVRNNVIRFEPNVIRATSDGVSLSNFTNNNRAIELRGWRWTVEGNDYEVYSNFGLTGTRYNDGEGIMHEAWVNVDLRGGTIRNNRGNAYICIWRVPVYGLTIEGNQVSGAPMGAIFVLGQTNRDLNLPVENLIIRNNRTSGGGIRAIGQPGRNNVIENNTHLGPPGSGRLENFVRARTRNNEGFADGESAFE